MTFDEFMKKVNQYLIKKTGMDSEWLPDYCYWDCWDSEMTPLETALEAIENAKTF